MIDKHFAYEAADDVDGVMSTLTDNIEHDVVGFPEARSAVPKSVAGAFTS